MTTEQIKAAETYLDAKRNVLPSTVRYNYKDTYNYLFTMMNKEFNTKYDESNNFGTKCDESQPKEKSYSVFSLLVYYLKYKKLPD